MLDTLINRSSKDRTKISPVVRNFCLRLQFHSNRAYQELRAFFDNALPTSNTLRRWLRCVDAKPGITEMALDAISEKAKAYKNEGKKLHVCLMSDEMSTMKHLSWFRAKKLFSGFCSNTNSTTNRNAESMGQDDIKKMPISKDALVFMAVGPDFKIPVAYFLLTGLNAVDRAALTLEVVKSIDERGAKVTSFTSDGLNANLATAKELGADFKNNRPFFLRPSNKKERIHIIFDVPHMLKLVRKHFAEGKLSYNGEKLNWELIKILVSKQSKENFNYGNKLTRHHINWHTQPMNVRLACETISNSVADALEQLDEDGYEEFHECGPTVKFVRLFNNVYDAMNQRENKKTNECFKQPLCEANIDKFKDLFKEFYDFVSKMEITTSYTRNNITHTRQKPVINGSLCMGFFGFVHNITSNIGIFEDYVRNGSLDAFYTFQYSQDHLETFFALLRLGLGNNINPTPQQFEARYRRLLVCSPYLNAEKTNCNINVTNTLLVSSSAQYSSTTNDRSQQLIQPIEIDLDYNYVINQPKDPYNEHMCAYIASNVEMAMKQRMKSHHRLECQDCIDVFDECPKVQDSLIAKKMKTDPFLSQPCESTIHIIWICDEVSSQLELKKEYFSFELTAQTMLESLDVETLYDSASFDSHEKDENIHMTHKQKFIYNIVEEYMHLKSRRISSKITEEEKGELIRKKKKRRNRILAGQ